MSRGPGRVQRAIEALLHAEPDATFTVTDLVRHVYGSDAIGTPAQRRSVHRAVRHVLARNASWSKASRLTRRNHPRGPGGAQRLIYNRMSRKSVKGAGEDWEKGSRR
jgi:hypothetical protein